MTHSLAHLLAYSQKSFLSVSCILVLSFAWLPRAVAGVEEVDKTFEAYGKANDDFYHAIRYKHLDQKTITQLRHQYTAAPLAEHHQAFNKAMGEVYSSYGLVQREVKKELPETKIPEIVSKEEFQKRQGLNQPLDLKSAQKKSAQAGAVDEISIVKQEDHSPVRYDRSGIDEVVKFPGPATAGTNAVRAPASDSHKSSK